MASVYDFTVRTIDGTPQSLNAYKGRWLLIVNVASKCGFTPQYRGLEALWRQYKARGLTVLGFPCDQFGQQEPGTEAEIKSFCELNYEVSFPMFAKIEVNGDGAEPLYRFLKHEGKGLLGTEFIKWNFTKFLVGPDGEVIKRFGPGDTPEAIEKELARLLPAA